MGCLRARESWVSSSSPNTVRSENALLGFAPHLAQALADLGDDAVVDEEELSLLEQSALGFERLVLCSELVESDDAVHKRDVGRLEEVLVRSLRVLDEQRDGGSARVEDGMGEGTARAGLAGWFVGVEGGTRNVQTNWLVDLSLCGLLHSNDEEDLLLLLSKEVLLLSLELDLCDVGEEGGESLFALRS